MTKRVSAREARAHFAELTDEVRYTGEPAIVEKQGRPFVAMISMEDFERLERAKHQDAAFANFTRLAKAAARPEDADLTDEEIVAAAKQTRRELNRERYGGA